jgi:hypothetical protein
VVFSADFITNCIQKNKWDSSGKFVLPPAGFQPPTNTATVTIASLRDIKARPPVPAQNNTKSSKQNESAQIPVATTQAHNAPVKRRFSKIPTTPQPENQIFETPAPPLKRVQVLISDIDAKKNPPPSAPHPKQVPSQPIVSVEPLPVPKTAPNLHAKSSQLGKRPLPTANATVVPQVIVQIEDFEEQDAPTPMAACHSRFQELSEVDYYDENAINFHGLGPASPGLLDRFDLFEVNANGYRYNRVTRK